MVLEWCWCGEDTASARLGCDRRVVTGDGVAIGWRAARGLGWIILVVAVDNRGQTGGGVGGNTKVIIQVTVACAGDTPFTDATVVNDRRGLRLAKGAPRRRGQQVLREVDVPRRAAWVAIRRGDAVVVGRAVPDDVQLPGVSGDAPRHDRRGRRALIDLIRAAPGLPVVRGEAVVHVVVVGVDGVHGASAVNAHVDELVAVAG